MVLYSHSWIRSTFVHDINVSLTFIHSARLCFDRSGLSSVKREVQLLTAVGEIILTEQWVIKEPIGVWMR